MSCPTPTNPRPVAVDIAFWLLIAAAAGLIAGGLLLVFSTSAIPGFFRGAGALFGVAGAVLAYLVSRARSGDTRFRRATVGMAMALVALLALFALISQGVVWLLIMVAAIVGAVLLIRPAATDWFGGARS